MPWPGIGRRTSQPGWMTTSASRFALRSSRPPWNATGSRASRSRLIGPGKPGRRPDRNPLPIRRPRQMSEVPVLDQSVLSELQETTGDDPEFLRDLIETYLADVPVQLEGIDGAIAANDADALVRPAHTLKSSSMTLGAMRLGEISRT